MYVADAAGIYVPQLDRVEPTSPPSNFDLDQVVEDATFVRSLDPEVLCYPHYGPVGGETGGVGGPDARADALAYLDEYVEVTREWVAAIEAEWERLGDESAVIDHFVERTEMDAVWGDRKATAETRLNVRGVLQYLKGMEGD